MAARRAAGAAGRGNGKSGHGILARHDSPGRPKRKPRALLEFLQNSSRPHPPGPRQKEEAGLTKALAALDAAGSAIEQSGDVPPANQAPLRTTLGAAYANLGESSKAVPQFQKALDLRQQALGREHPDTLAAMEDLARALVAADKASEAESQWRQVVAVREAKTPDDWLTFYSRAMLGDSLARQQKFVEAEPLVLAGYEGMKAREFTIPMAVQNRLAEAGARLIVLYDAWGKKDKADEWRKRLSASSRP